MRVNLPARALARAHYFRTVRHTRGHSQRESNDESDDAGLIRSSPSCSGLGSRFA